jgi:hypothetical protein
MFEENFRHYADGVSAEVRSSGPVVTGQVDTAGLRFSKPGEG